MFLFLLRRVVLNFCSLPLLRGLKCACVRTHTYTPICVPTRTPPSADTSSAVLVARTSTSCQWNVEVVPCWFGNQVLWSRAPVSWYLQLARQDIIDVPTSDFLTQEDLHFLIWPRSFRGVWKVEEIPGSVFPMYWCILRKSQCKLNRCDYE